jgi:hypothetical protein
LIVGCVDICCDARIVAGEYKYKDEQGKLISSISMPNKVLFDLLSVIDKNIFFLYVSAHPTLSKPILLDFNPIVMFYKNPGQSSSNHFQTNSLGFTPIVMTYKDPGQSPSNHLQTNYLGV